MTIKPAKRKPEVENAPLNGEEGFPSVRYFQVHFEYLENLLNETRACLDALKRQVAAVNQGSVTPSGAELELPSARPPHLALDGERPPRRNGQRAGQKTWEDS